MGWVSKGFRAGNWGGGGHWVNWGHMLEGERIIGMVALDLELGAWVVKGVIAGQGDTYRGWAGGGEYWAGSGGVHPGHNGGTVTGGFAGKT